MSVTRHALASLVLLAACVVATTTARLPTTTLFIENHSGDPLAIYVDGRRVGTVDAMRPACVKLWGVRHASLSIGIKPLAQRVFHTEPMVLAAFDGWFLEWGHTPALDLISLRPANPCGR